MPSLYDGHHTFLYMHLLVPMTQKFANISVLSSLASPCPYWLPLWWPRSNKSQPALNQPIADTRRAVQPCGRYWISSKSSVSQHRCSVVRKYLNKTPKQYTLHLSKHTQKHNSNHISHHFLPHSIVHFLQINSPHWKALPRPISSTHIFRSKHHSVQSYQKPHLFSKHLSNILHLIQRCHSYPTHGFFQSFLSKSIRSIYPLQLRLHWTSAVLPSLYRPPDHVNTFRIELAQSVTSSSPSPVASLIPNALQHNSSVVLKIIDSWSFIHASSSTCLSLWE